MFEFPYLALDHFQKSGCASVGLNVQHNVLLCCLGVEFYATMMKIIVSFQPNDFCVSKLHGFDPKFSEESFKTSLKLVGCVVKEL